MGIRRVVRIEVLLAIAMMITAFSVFNYHLNKVLLLR